MALTKMKNADRFRDNQFGIPPQAVAPHFVASLLIADEGFRRDVFKKGFVAGLLYRVD
jgi:hypothetical protein